MLDAYEIYNACWMLIAPRMSSLQELKGKSGVMIILNMDLFRLRSEESSHEPSAQCMFCNVSIQVFNSFKSAGSFAKQTLHLSEQAHTIFQATVPGGSQPRNCYSPKFQNMFNC